MTTTAAPDTSQISQPAPSRSGPSLVIPAIVTFVTLVASLIVGVVFAKALYANPFSDSADLQKYFIDHPTMVRFVALLQFCSAIGLAVLTAVAWSKLRQIVPTIIPPVAIAVIGGTISATFLALNAMIQWTLTFPAVNGDLALVRALNYLFFGLGGPAHVAALGLLVFGLASAGRGLRLLPGWFTVAGYVIVALSAVSILTVATQSFAPFIPLGRFLGLIWLVVLSFLTRRGQRA